MSHRPFLSAVALGVALSGLALASAVAAQDAGAEPIAPCPYYPGSASFEFKAGSERNLGSTTAFLPVACSADSLLFADLRFKMDEFHNREGNAGLGVRFLTDWDGILGAYAFYDRKLSDTTNKWHTQATLGGEWLSSVYELRANGYIPLTGDKSVPYGPASGTALSGPFLAGTSIFVTETAPMVLTEKPMHGFDAEIGVRVPFLPDLWAHAGGFRFKADGGKSLMGGRARLTYDFTQNLALTAEGQWDDERGRQGWLGARLHFAVGGPDEPATGLRSRMTALPVRDVDIVTSAAVVGAPTQEAPVLNAATGEAQRVLYVDNTAAPDGDGSLARPFATLAAAETVMQDHDVVYIARGDGTTAGQNQGITLSRADVQMIGAGSAFVYDGGRFSIQSGDFTGVVLRAAGTAPVITNVNAEGNGVTVTGDNALLSGFTVDGAAQDGVNILNATATVDNVTTQNNGRYGLYALSNTAGEGRTFTAQNVTASGNASVGVNVQSEGAGSSIGNVALSDILVQTNGGNGFYVRTTSGGQIGSASLQNITSSGNILIGGRIFATGAGSSIDSVTASNILAQANGDRGLLLSTSAGGQIGAASLQDVTTSGNGGGGGTVIQADGAGSSIDFLTASNILAQNNGNIGLAVYATNSGQISNASLQQVTSSGNTGAGLYVLALNQGSFNGVEVENVTATGNSSNGVFIDDDTTGTFVVDMGGGALGSTGGNRVFGNTGTDIRADMDNGELKAQHNWWGDAAGLQPGRMTLDAGSTIDASNFLAVDPAP